MKFIYYIFLSLVVFLETKATILSNLKNKASQQTEREKSHEAQQNAIKADFLNRVEKGDLNVFQNQKANFLGLLTNFVNKDEIIAQMDQARGEHKSSNWFSRKWNKANFKAEQAQMMLNIQKYDTANRNMYQGISTWYIQQYQLFTQQMQRYLRTPYGTFIRAIDRNIWLARGQVIYELDALQKIYDSKLDYYRIQEEIKQKQIKQKAIKDNAEQIRIADEIEDLHAEMIEANVEFFKNTQKVYISNIEPSVPNGAQTMNKIITKEVENFGAQIFCYQFTDVTYDCGAGKEYVNGKCHKVCNEDYTRKKDKCEPVCPSHLTYPDKLCKQSGWFTKEIYLRQKIGSEYNMWQKDETKKTYTTQPESNQPNKMCPNRILQIKSSFFKEYCSVPSKTDGCKIIGMQKCSAGVLFQGCAFDKERCAKTKVDMGISVITGVLTTVSMIASIMNPAGLAIITAISWIKWAATLGKQLETMIYQIRDKLTLFKNTVTNSRKREILELRMFDKLKDHKELKKILGNDQFQAKLRIAIESVINTQYQIVDGQNMGKLASVALGGVLNKNTASSWFYSAGGYVEKFKWKGSAWEKQFKEWFLKDLMNNPTGASTVNAEKNSYTMSYTESYTYGLFGLGTVTSLATAIEQCAKGGGAALACKKSIMGFIGSFDPTGMIGVASAFVHPQCDFKYTLKSKLMKHKRKMSHKLK